jgi:hypothetical protein
MLDHDSIQVRSIPSDKLALGAPVEIRLVTGLYMRFPDVVEI